MVVFFSKNLKLLNREIKKPIVENENIEKYKCNLKKEKQVLAIKVFVTKKYIGFHQLRKFCLYPSKKFLNYHNICMRCWFHSSHRRLLYQQGSR